MQDAANAIVKDGGALCLQRSVGSHIGGRMIIPANDKPEHRKPYIDGVHAELTQMSFVESH